MLTEILILALLGGLFELDRTVAVQSLVAEPIVVAPVAGWLLGDTLLGVQMGILLELFFLGNVSIGGSIPPDGTLAALVAAGSAGLIGAETQGVSREALTAGSALLLMIPASRIGRWVEGRIKDNNVKLAHQADDRAVKEGVRAIEKIVHFQIAKDFLLWATVSGLALCAGTLALNVLLRVLPGQLLNALEGSSKLLPLVAAGVALSAIKIRRARWWFAGACVCLLAVSIGIG